MLNDKWIDIVFAASVYAQNGRYVIGQDGDIPWRGKIPSDMARFVRLTEKKSVIMGRKTWYSIPLKFRSFDKDLPVEESRQTIILTRDKNMRVDDPRVVIAHSPEEAVNLAKSRIVWICGGAEIYELFLPWADFIHMTLVSGRFPGDTFFPLFDTNEWKKVASEFYHAGGAKNPKDKFDTFYQIFQRRIIA